MENTDLETFMVKLRRLVYDNDHDTPIGNNPLIRARQPQIQLLYEELSSLINGSCFKDEDDLQDFGNWMGRVIQAADDAEDTVDMFLSLAIIKYDDRRQSMTNSHHLLRLSLKDLQGVTENLKSIRAEMSIKKVNLYHNYVNRQDMTSTDNKFEATCVMQRCKQKRRSNHVDSKNTRKELLKTLKKDEDRK